MKEILAKGIRINLSDRIKCQTIINKGYILYIQKQVNKGKSVGKWKNKYFNISDVSTMSFDKSRYVWVTPMS